MDISGIIVKMIEFSDGNRHDINHFLKVYAYAKTIAERERISDEEKITAETAAVVHDIACPLCREKYGNTNGKYQEAEGIIIARKFLENAKLPDHILERVVYLVGHHHTYKNIDGIDYQILLEADYLVNADESNYSRENIQNAANTLFKTNTGISMLKSIYNIN